METYNYIFWHNQYQDLWYAIPRDGYLEFFNGNREKVKGVLSNKSINSLTLAINGKEN